MSFHSIGTSVERNHIVSQPLVHYQSKPFSAPPLVGFHPPWDSPFSLRSWFLQHLVQCFFLCFSRKPVTPQIAIWHWHLPSLHFFCSLYSSCNPYNSHVSPLFFPAEVLMRRLLSGLLWKDLYLKCSINFSSCQCLLSHPSNLHCRRNLKREAVCKYHVYLKVHLVIWFFL